MISCVYPSLNLSSEKRLKRELLVCRTAELPSLSTENNHYGAAPAGGLYQFLVHNEDYGFRGEN